MTTTGPAPGLTSVMTPAAYRSPDDVVSAVVLAGDAVEGLDVDGMGNANGRFQLGAAGKALGHGSHLLVIWVSCRDCSQNPGNSRYCPGREVHALANRAGHAVITM